MRSSAPHPSRPSGRVAFQQTEAPSPTTIPVGSSSTLRSYHSCGGNYSAASSDPVELAKGIFFEGIQTVIPSTLIHSQVEVHGCLVKFKDEKGTTIDLSQYDRKYIVGFGKACLLMAETLLQLLHNKIDRTIISAPFGSRASTDNNIEVHYGARGNIPDVDSFNASKAIVNLVQSCMKRDLLIVLISGGGSALLTYPIHPITQEENKELIGKLRQAGCTTNELNTVRKRLSLVKGGGLVGMCKAGKIVSLIISGFSGSPVQVIGSGPTAENFDSPDAARDIIIKYGLENEVPPTIQNVLSKPPAPQNLEIFNKVTNFIIGDNKIALEGAATAATNRELSPFIITTSLFGEAADVGYNLAHVTEALAFCLQRKGSKQADDSILHSCVEAIKRVFKQYNWSTRGILEKIFTEYDKPTKGICLLFGGETTLTVRRNGKGGRNQELALSAGIKLDLSRNAPNVKGKVAILSAGTDSFDGPNDAAGAVIEDFTIHNAQQEGLSPVTFLKEQDSFHFFEKASGGKYHVICGNTETNLPDMVIIVILKKSAKKSML